MVRPQSGPAMTQASGAPDSFDHLPVMAAEVVELMVPAPPGVLLDATLGAAGHAAAILDAAPQLSLIGLDQDPAAIAAATITLERFGHRAQAVGRRFDGLNEVLDSLGVEQVSGVLFDLGVSSPQLDRPERGFSYRSPAPLDMRMDPGRPYSRERRRQRLGRTASGAGCSGDQRGSPLCPENRQSHRGGPTAHDDGRTGRDRQGRHSRRRPAHGRTSGSKSVPGRPDRRQRGTRNPARRPGRGPEPARAAWEMRSPLLSLRRGPHSQGPLPSSGYGGVHMPSGAPVRLWGCSHRPSAQPGSSPPDRPRGRGQSPRRERPVAGRRGPSRSAGPMTQDGVARPAAGPPTPAGRPWCLRRCPSEGCGLLGRAAAAATSAGTPAAAPAGRGAMRGGPPAG